MSALFLTVPVKPQAKARPRVTKNGTYMPRAYQEWRADFVKGLAGQVPAEPMAGKFHARIEFFTKSGEMRPDLDNALGAVLDALQDAQVITNDRNCKRFVSCGVTKAKDYRIEIDLAEVA